MRRTAVVVLVALLAGQAFAAGFGGSDAPPARIPVPAHDFAATVMDNSGVRVEVTQVSYNGEVFVYGRVGEGQVTVPFTTIASVRFEPSTEANKRIAFIVMRDGTSVNVVVEDDVPAYGRTSYGTYSITTDKIKVIEFAAGPVAPAATP